MESGMNGRIQGVLGRMSAAAARSGRDLSDISLVAVSKTVGLPSMEEAMACGLFRFGENRVQEYLLKQQALGASAEWHFIGRIQTNKVKQLTGHPMLLHSLDRLELLDEMRRQSERTGWRWRALLEVNVSGEASKAGVSPENLEGMVRRVSEAGCVDLIGLMTVAPYGAKPEAARPFFHRLREMSIDIRSWKLDNVVMTHLSMGMSHDLEVAVEEGATLVRVGTALFGSRT